VFDGFEQRRIAGSGAAIHVRVGGRGAPLLLLHGYPQTGAMWHRVAPELARHFTVVAPDLRGYGDSDRPAAGPDHAAYAKRAMAADQVAVMGALGFERFAVAGHDRGGRVAYRLALDAPERVTRLAVLDIIPTGSVFAAVDKGVAMSTYHWFFLSQPFDLPERLIGADPEFFLRWTLASWSGDGLASFAPEALAEYLRAFQDPAVIHATCEDYRAGATVDDETDRADLGHRRIACPTLVLWGDRRANRRGRTGAVERRDPLAVWREWAADVRGQALACGHFLAEEAPGETAAALRDFFGGGV
jgi:haloacetate dehalogenase